jgi:hypothetical protein
MTDCAQLHRAWLQFSRQAGKSKSTSGLLAVNLQPLRTRFLWQETIPYDQRNAERQGILLAFFNYHVKVFLSEVHGQA